MTTKELIDLMLTWPQDAEVEITPSYGIKYVSKSPIDGFATEVALPSEEAPK